MRKSTMVAIAAGVVVVTAVGFSAARAQDSQVEHEAAPAALLTPKDLPAAWHAATGAIDDPLPAGRTFPSDPPPFFDTDEAGSAQAFAPVLPKQIAARWWRCAWIESALDASPSEAAAAKDQAESMVGRWYDLPGMKDQGVFSNYDSDMRAAAAAAGESEFQVEFDLDCGQLVFEEKGNP